MGAALRGVASTMLSPLTWAFGLLVTAMEIPAAFLSFSSANLMGAAPGLPGEAVPELWSAAVYGVVFLAAPLLRPLRYQAWLFVMSPILGVLGVLVCCIPGQQDIHPLTAWAGMVCLQTAMAVLLLLSLELLAKQPSLAVRRIVVGGSLINAFAMGGAEAAPLPWALVTLTLGSAALGLARYRAAGCAECEDDPVPGRPLRFPLALAAGLLAIVASFGFLQELLYQQEVGVVSSVVLGTKLAAVALFVGVLALQGDTNYAILAQLIGTFAVAAFLVFLAQGSYSLAPSAIMDTGYSLLEMTTLVMVAELAATVRVKPLRLFAAFYFVESVGYVAGCLMTQVSVGAWGFDLRLTAVVLSLALVVCAIWVFTEKRVNEFLWGPSTGEDSEVFGEREAGELRSGKCDAEAKARAGSELPLALEESPFGRKAAVVADRYRLSPREAEVLELFAAGRSAVFIAELQFVTTNTVRSHIKHIYRKCDVHSRQELITLIEQQGQNMA